jgi:hypothetical protein
MESSNREAQRAAAHATMTKLVEAKLNRELPEQQMQRYELIFIRSSIGVCEVPDVPLM